MTARQAKFRSFEESTEQDWAIIAPQLNVTQSLVPAHVLEQMRYLRNDHGGFPVDRLEHSLQTATLAERDGRDEEYVLCALLHDIGDTLSPFNHPPIGAAILKPFVSEANLWMVEHHGIFQGYYFWHYIGLDKNAREAYRDSPNIRAELSFVESGFLLHDALGHLGPDRLLLGSHAPIHMIAPNAAKPTEDRCDAAIVARLGHENFDRFFAQSPAAARTP